MTPLSPSGLRKIDSNDGSTWPTHIAYNLGLLNSSLLFVSGMGDSTISSPQNEDGLMWDSGLQRYVNRPQSYTTTTTTTTTTA